jgi:hypothetical protein
LRQICDMILRETAMSSFQHIKCINMHI